MNSTQFIRHDISHALTAGEKTLYTHSDKYDPKLSKSELYAAHLDQVSRWKKFSAFINSKIDSTDIELRGLTRLKIILSNILKMNFLLITAREG